MLCDILDSIDAKDEREAIRTAVSATTWSELQCQYLRYASEYDRLRGHRVALALPASGEGVAALAALEKLCAHVFLMDAQMPTPQLRKLATQLGLVAVLTAADLEESVRVACDPVEADDAGSITILTSGTSGHPKAVQYLFENLVRPVRRTGIHGQRWLMAYRPHLYAGLQVTLQALLNHGTLVMPPSDANPQAVADLMVETMVEYASATPSYWRRLLLFADPNVLRCVPMKQVTLGGEAIDQPILDQLSNCFPQARIVHIYATTEAGRCFSVSDGLAGFPISFLEAPSPDGVELRIVDGELYVRSANAMAKYDERSQSPTSRLAAWRVVQDRRPR